MADRHKTTPLSIRLPDAERQRLDDYAERHGLPVRRVILDAIREKLDGEFPGAGAPDVPSASDAGALSQAGGPGGH